MKKYHVAIVGATGLQGQECINILEQRKFPAASLRLFSSDKASGRKVFVSHREMAVYEPSSQAFDYANIAFFLEGAGTSTHYAPLAVQAGALVVDTSSAFRLDPWVPLVVPEVNLRDAAKHKGVISTPSSGVIPLVMVLHALNKRSRIKRVVVNSFHSVSGSGARAMEELTTQSKLAIEGKAVAPHIYPHQIAFNLLPEVDVFMDDGYTREEWKIGQETRKILHVDDLPISATAVRTPVYIGNSLAVNLEFASSLSREDARGILAEAPGIKVQDDPTVSLYPQPWSAARTDEVFVGRIRKDTSCDNGLALWIVTDNLRKGAALNAIQIAEAMLRNDSTP
ncbi:MAG: aspartate-semialdehyde dehydrogenase [Chloroflexi bacterium]|nr:aspartate-semialdehyde dehydrogenase [Chloroflexota bacterium]